MILRDAVTLRDRQHVPVDVGRRLGPEDRGAARSRVALEHLQPDVEVVERALADRARGLARRLEVVELDQRFAPLGDEFTLDLLQVALQLGVAHVVVRAFLEVHRGDLHCGPVSVRERPSRRPALRRCAVPRGRVSPRRRSRPSMLSMQPRSPSTTASAPERRDMLAFVVREPRRDLAVFDREGSAEAAAGLALGHFGEPDAGHPGQQRARLLLDAHLAQSGAAVMIGDRAGIRCRAPRRA